MEVPCQVMPQLGYVGPSGEVLQPPTEAASIIRPHRRTAMPMAPSQAMGTAQSILPGMPFACPLAPSQVRSSPQAVTMSYQGQVAMTMPQGMISGVSSWHAPVPAVSASLQLPPRTMPVQDPLAASVASRVALPCPSVVPQPASMTVPGRPMQRTMPVGLGTACSSSAPSPGFLAGAAANTAQPSLQPQPQLQQMMRFQQPQVAQSQHGQSLPQHYCQAPLVQMQMPLTPPRQQPFQMTTQQLQPQPQQAPFQMRALQQGQVVQPQLSHMSPVPQQSQQQAFQQLPQAQSRAWAAPTRQPPVQLVQPMGTQPMQPPRYPVPSASAMPPNYARYVGQGGGVAAEAAKRAAMAFPLP